MPGRQVSRRISGHVALRRFDLRHHMRQRLRHEIVNFHYLRLSESVTAGAPQAEAMLDIHARGGCALRSPMKKLFTNRKDP